MKYKNLYSLKGKIAVVTGAAGLIGKEITAALAESGAVVVAADIKKAPEGNSIVFRSVDTAKEKGVSSLIDFIDKEYGRMNIWVNSAYPKTSDWPAKFEDIPLDSWNKNIKMQLGGYFICCQKAAEYMKRKKAGSVINMASIYGVKAPDFSIYEGTKMTLPAAYSVIKSGVINFTKYLASYYGKHNVRINCISPGGVYDGQRSAFVKNYIKKVPLGRMAKTEDIAAAVLYLGSDAAQYVTGHNLVVDGGWTTR